MVSQLKLTLFVIDRALNDTTSHQRRIRRQMADTDKRSTRSVPMIVDRPFYTPTAEQVREGVLDLHDAQSTDSSVKTIPRLIQPRQRFFGGPI